MPGCDAAVMTAGTVLGVREGYGAVLAGAGPGGAGVGVALVDVRLAHPGSIGRAVLGGRDDEGEDQQQRDGKWVHRARLSARGPVWEAKSRELGP